MSGLTSAIETIAAGLNRGSASWLLGGSCSLLLQGVKLDRFPRDIDVYADAEDVMLLHSCLSVDVIRSPQRDREGMYDSLLSRYKLKGYEAELVGGFKVSSGGSYYEVKIKSLLYRHAVKYELEKTSIFLMPLSHEFVFNILRGRPDRYEPIAELIRQNPAPHHELLKHMLSLFTWSEEHKAKIKRLTGIENEIT
ncbi:hypothetical protein HII30_14440 [Paenibacillus lemnae]|uniref:Nucleotidyl transferase AbiEii/AbiGii toxin family protein n=2 Tax=Paenibacillus lemnae TaxID=1330551 RepID=A0A848M9T1_PAELE|nr:hypothetical protein [Paenibacillus lemnae]